MASEQAFWEELAASALVGVERRGTLPSAPAGALGALVARIDQSDASGALLDAAIATICYLRAGALPQTGGVAPFAPCEPDDLPVCSPRSGQHLVSMLNGTYREALPEWLDTLARTGRRVPETQLPALLELGRLDTDLQPKIVPVLGQRGRWLASLHPDWNFLPTELPTDASQDDGAETVWTTSDPATRSALLQRLRAEQPQRGRELLLSTWATDPANDRASFLDAFITGLSIDDEPFLESALDDRSKNVRRKASELLARIGESHFVARMVARVTPLLTWVEGKGKRKAQIEVTLPDEPDAALIRDGVERKKSASDNVGVRSNQLSHMLTLVPPSHWCRLWGKTPAEIMAAAQKGDWGNILLHSFRFATLIHRDLDWAEAIIHTNRVSDTIFDLLPVKRQQDLAVALLGRDRPLNSSHPAIPLLLQLPKPWPPEVARAVIAGLQRYLAKHSAKERNDWGLASNLINFAAAIPTELAAEATGNWLDTTSEAQFWQEAVQKYKQILLFRAEMLKEIHA